VTVRFTLAILLIAVVVRPSAAQTPTPAPPSADVQTLIASLGSLEYPVRTRAARQLRRLPDAEAIQALSATVRNTAGDEFVRYRAFVLLSSFSERAMADMARLVLADRNDRLRQVAYQWFERHPDSQMTTKLAGALQTEQAEFVRPALLGALAAIGDGNAPIQRMLITEIGRGLDMFRSAIIESLGEHRAAYAVDAIAAVAQLEGPLQDDAVVALGKIGGTKGSAVLVDLAKGAGDIALTARASLCVSGTGCDETIKLLLDTAVSTRTTASRARAALGGLAAIATTGNAPALNAIATVGARTDAVREEAVLALAGVAVRQPQPVLTWLDTAPEETRRVALGLLKDGFETLEEDFGEEQFFATARANYWKVAEGSPTRTLIASIIDALEF
jgi:hypothetical protein